jgi:glucose-6-phosphate isomerase
MTKSIGNSKLLQYSPENLFADRVGSEGISKEEVQAELDRGREAIARLAKQVADGEVGFANLPSDHETLKKVQAFARRQRSRYRHVVLLGIGGSALGPLALDRALNGIPPFRRKNCPELIVLDNIDPDPLAAVLTALRPKETLVLVITKSGSTAETMAQFLVVHGWLSRALGKQARERIVAITDPERGELLRLAREEGYECFAIPPNVGGRYSVLSAVGLVPSVLVGIDVARLLAGAAAMNSVCHPAEQADPAQNPAFQAALHQSLLAMRHSKTIQVIFAYSRALWDMAFWHRQLWAESLGKRVDSSGREVFAGQTLVAALGVTDQHSQLQLYIEGPRDKAITFWQVAKPGPSVRIPRRFSNYDSLGYLGGHTLDELFRAEKAATEAALTAAGRPNATIIVPAVDAHSLGQLIQFLQFAAAYAGELWGVDAFDQPGVELGKRITYGLMGRKGFEEYRAGVKQKS